MRVLVTGAGHGLGLALTLELLERGATVVGVDRDPAALERLARGYVDLFEGRLCDLGDLGAVERLLQRFDAPFDLVALNAGISATGNFARIPAEAYDRLIRINVSAPLLMAQRMVRDDRIARGGTIVFVSSLSHVTGYPGASVYAATKDAVAVYARSVRKPFAKRGVRVLTVFPGPIRTAHAERHAPAGAKASRRMDPRSLARQILKAVRQRERVLYPGLGALTAYTLGSLMPRTATRLMGRVLFRKLKREVY